jgi:hypothetical protein
MVMATVVIDKVNTVAERTQKEEKMLLQKICKRRGPAAWLYRDTLVV